MINLHDESVLCSSFILVRASCSAIVKALFVIILNLRFGALEINILYSHVEYSEITFYWSSNIEANIEINHVSWFLMEDKSHRCLTSVERASFWLM